MKVNWRNGDCCCCNSCNKKTDIVFIRLVTVGGCAPLCYRVVYFSHYVLHTPSGCSDAIKRYVCYVLCDFDE